MNRDIWWRQISDDSDRRFPCPHCGTGGVVLVKSSVQRLQPKYNADAIAKHEDAEFDWEVQRFIAFLRCDSKACGEIVSAGGDTEFVEIDTEFGQGFDQALRIRSLFPAPAIFFVPKKTPERVVELLGQAFALYWVDPAACAAKLRASVEEMLNERGVPITKVSKKKKLVRLDLNARIALFKGTDADNGDFLDALRVIGNVGAHEGKLDDDKILDVCEIYEKVLEEVYEQKTAKLKSLTKKIVSTKGKY